MAKGQLVSVSPKKVNNPTLNSRPPGWKRKIPLKAPHNKNMPAGVTNSIMASMATNANGKLKNTSAPTPHVRSRLSMAQIVDYNAYNSTLFGLIAPRMDHKVSF